MCKISLDGQNVAIVGVDQGKSTDLHKGVYRNVNNTVFIMYKLWQGTRMQTLLSTGAFAPRALTSLSSE
jgi:hypothetical protein